MAVEKVDIFSESKGEEINQTLKSLVTAVEGLQGGGSTAAYNGLEAESWEEIAADCKAGYAAGKFHIGQEKTIYVNGEKCTAVIVDFNHDDLASTDDSYNNGSGKAAITWVLKNALKTTYPMNSSNDNTTSWQNCAMRSTVQGIYSDGLDSDLKAAIRAVSKKTATSGSSSTIITTADELWIPSHVEVFGTCYQNPDSQLSYTGEGTQYRIWNGAQVCPPPYYYEEAYSGMTFVDQFGGTYSLYSDYFHIPAAIKGLGDTATSSNYWWLRSPNVGLSSRFCGVSGNGNVRGSGASSSFGLVLGFCT